jgi:uncharacterized protein
MRSNSRGITVIADPLDGAAVAAALDGDGYAIVPGLLAAADCAALAAGYDADGLYRSRVVMARHGFGQGEYRYFDYPLPDTVAALRAAFWPLLQPVANRWNATLGEPGRFPADHGDYLAHCHCAGQTRATPLLLKYGPGDYYCLHQPATIIACIRISMESRCFRCNLPYCCRSRRQILPAASSC